MRSVFALLCGLGAASLASPALAQSETESFLSVTREIGAESCPDTFSLSQHVERLQGHPATSAPSTYRVTFSRQAGEFRAAIRVRGGSGVRLLRDRGPSCASLEQATALTLALLMDSDAPELVPEKPDPEPGHTGDSSPPLVVPPAPPVVRPPSVRLSLSFGGGGLFGVAAPAAPVAIADLGIGAGRFRTSVGLLWMPEQTLDFGPGRLRESLVSGRARLCLTTARGSLLRLDVCSGVYAGLVHVQASGYTGNGGADKAWLALPLELSLASTSTPVGVELGATTLVPLRRNDFSITHLGTAYESWPVGMLLSLRAVGSWLL
jgi:hypothetical protein